MTPASPLTLQPAIDWRAVLSVLLSVFLVVMDVSIANVALPSLSQELQVSAASSVWIVSIYQVAAAASLLPFAALGGRFSNRIVYISGLAMFLLCSLLCALAQNFTTLVIARFAQGLGASAVMAVNAAMLAQLFPLQRLGQGIGWNALTVGVAFAAGPLVSAMLLTFADWRWLFLINLPLGGIALLGCLRYLPTSSSLPGSFRPLASLLCFLLFLCGGLAVVLYSQGQHNMYLSLSAAIAVLTALGLWWVERGQSTPVVPVDLLKNPMFRLSNLTALFAFTTQASIFVALPFYFTHLMQMSALHTGAMMTPWSAAVALMAPLVGRAADRWHPGPMGAVGFTLIALGITLFLLWHDSSSLILVYMVICGVGFSLFQSPNQRAILTSAPSQRRSAASGMVACVRLIGQCLGAGLTALCLLGGDQQGPVYALSLAIILALLAALCSGLRWRIRTAAPVARP
ncbi:MFS transporter [Pokkaliibacter sp. MBI-7]|uniref:MFS transporter n=1 Tax=Pokkaliibacter sp. MBI-7 TaxID=3040600 RepID=UPI00244ACD02|nr:MFS transporter [Pokkaliibacter sp. MBI-7]MDH2433227.1 MFS transporter [Pokkaliibacter sp. MBI-7]